LEDWDFRKGISAPRKSGLGFLFFVVGRERYHMCDVREATRVRERNKIWLGMRSVHCFHGSFHKYIYTKPLPSL
jgi:hypothetical protein